MPDLTKPADLDVRVAVPDIQRFDTRSAPDYERYTDQYEAAPKARGFALLDRQPGDRYLEVAVGGGGNFAAVIETSGVDHAVGVDLSSGMLDVNRAHRGVSRAPLVRADARRLPFAAASFDCVYNSYMLDLIPNDSIPVVVAEFARVLHPGGRLVLVNLTEGEGADAAFSEGWKCRYLEDPIRLGACRPVVVAPSLAALGFADLHREYVGGKGHWPAEVILAIRS